jgi:hypothetical protein
MKPLLLLILILVLGLGVTLLTRDDTQQPVEPDLSPVPKQSHSAFPETEHQLPDAKLVQSTSQPEPSSAPSPAETSTELLSQEQPNASDLELRQWAAQQLRLGKQYDHLERAGLQALLTDVQVKIAKQRKEHFKERLERGIYQIQFIDQPPVLPPSPDPRGRMPVQDVSVMTDPQTMTTQSNIVTLPFEEYPEFYDLLDEEQWLQDKIGG